MGALRILGGIVLCTLLWQSWRIATADVLANSSRPGDLDRAIALEPDNANYRIRKASADLFGEGLAPAHAEAELHEVLKQNRGNAQALMDLGLLAESRKDDVAAEGFLKQAAQSDLTFQPLWTLINFYYRTNQLNKMWPAVHKALVVTTKPDMLYFNVQSVYDLCWQADGDPKLILSLIPPNPEALLGYFFYLVQHGHVEAAEGIYPQALGFADPSNLYHQAVLTNYCNLQFQAHHIDRAVEVWNALVKKKFLVSTELHPDRGETIANPNFEFPFDRPPFGWFPSTNGDVATTYSPHSVLFEFNGKQQEVAQVLYKNLPVLPGRDYALTWSADGSRISRPSDPKEIGLKVHFYDGDHEIPSACSTLLAPEKDRGCSFHVPESTHALNMRLLAERLAGSVRIRGTLRVMNFGLTLRERPVS